MSELSNNEIKKQVDEEFESIKKLHTNLNIEEYMVDGDKDLPDFGNLEVYSYDNEIQTYKEESLQIMNDLTDLYLGDAPQIKEHSYIQTKIKEDAKYYASSQLLQTVSEELLIMIMRQIKQGDNNSNIIKAMNETMREMRENIKDGRNIRTDIEKKYKDMRKDFGLNETSKSMTEGVENEASSEEAVKIMDTSKLNDIIGNYLKNRD